MTDRELLELAAKAMGATEYGGLDDCRGPGVVLLDGVPTEYEGRGEFGYAWNPLNDRAQCFELMVQRRISLRVEDVAWGNRVEFIATGEAGERRFSVARAVSYQKIDAARVDPLPAAACRAIVTVVAEQGKAMP